MEQFSTLADLARFMATDPDQRVGALETVTRMIQSSGPLNSHLAFVPEPQRYERTKPLPSDTPVYGRFLTLTYDGHWPKLTLTEHQNRESMADHIVDWVLLRQDVFAIENGLLIPYHVTYSDANGPRRCSHPNTPAPALLWGDDDV